MVLDILGVPALTEVSSPPQPTQSDTVLVPSPSNQLVEQPKKEDILALAMECEKSGNKDCADMFFKIFDKLISNNIAPINGNPVINDNHSHLLPKRSIEHIASISSSASEKRMKRPLFDPAICNTHTNLGFTQYFDRNIQELRGPIPLTIFDQKWQAEALAYQTEKRPSTSNTNSNKAGRYNGYPYPNEWTLTAGEWERLHRSFSATLCEMYDYGQFCDWLAVHN
ncbi:hypothetical protein PCANC_10592 [Puccinia coronata f. sp. avenae]|uniref:Uncharacterized protein n=1 Tax=Puccinia coronata f. sp. avenae TaxID=200324 RepID=A0A2N5VR67_9BASI|nr:hypothetical protein PCANC_10592 [Puccinia coronata f. sp. avenae]